MTSPSPRGGAPAITVSGTTDATSFTATLPTHAAGDTFVAIISADGTPTISCTGWNYVYSAAQSSNVCEYVFVRSAVAAGSSEPNPTFLSSVAQQYAAAIYAIPGSSLLNVEATMTSSATTTADPPSFSPSAGTKDYLWIAGVSLNGGASTITAGPSGYSSFSTNGNGDSGGTTIGVAHKATTASSENPGAFANALTQWVSATVAVWETPVATAVKGSTLSLMGVG
jgi:hypothetical protein